MPNGITHVCIGDIHGDVEALRESLVQSGAAKYHMNGMGIRCMNPGYHVTLLGDLLDRGMWNDDVLKQVGDMQRKKMLTLIAGNHDLLFVAAMTSGRSLDVLNWCVNKGTSFLLERAQRDTLTWNDTAILNEPMPGTALMYAFAGKNWRQFLGRNGVERAYLAQAFASIQSDYGRRYHHIFESMQIFARPVPGVLAVHGGIGEKTVGLGGLGKLQAAWRKHQKNKTVGQIVQEQSKGDAALYETLWLRRDKDTDTLLEPKVVSMLQQEKKVPSLIVRGHDPQESGIQRLMPEGSGIYSLDADTGMTSSFNCSRFGYVKIRPNGVVVAGSSKKQEWEVGKIDEKGVFKPS